MDVTDISLPRPERSHITRLWRKIECCVQVGAERGLLYFLTPYSAENSPTAGPRRQPDHRMMRNPHHQVLESVVPGMEAFMQYNQPECIGINTEESA